MVMMPRRSHTKPAVPPDPTSRPEAEPEPTLEPTTIDGQTGSASEIAPRPSPGARSHAKLAPTPETAGRPLPTTPRELFDALPPLPLRTEIINGRMLVSPMGTPEHADAAMNLCRALWPIIDAHGLDAFTGNVDVCIDGPRDPVVPDFVLAPPDCPRWGRELLSSGLVMVAEVVSPGSVREDREDKPDLYRNAGQCSGRQAGGEGPRGSAR
ncbi:Uma2 family endonuclease [Sphaerisporangium sp. NPDC051017]|uniref:Uma2 family endonuclease n=1 Tax=Sphaerisporangium sp. NPDC051017 TaxID=3154636 RepID=UPI003427E920